MSSIKIQDLVAVCLIFDRWMTDVFTITAKCFLTMTISSDIYKAIIKLHSSSDVNNTLTHSTPEMETATSDIFSCVLLCWPV